jgi:hypothetical protein
MITDQGLDRSHCAFNNRHFDTGTLYLSGTVPIFTGSGIVNLEFQNNVFTTTTVQNGAHGTGTAGVAVGACNQGVYTPSDTSTLLFVETRIDDDDYLHFPRDLGRLFNMAALNNISVHSASWGMDAPGLYDDTSHEFDRVARLYDLLHVVSSGNTGTMISSPATGKNVISVGASMSRPEAFPWFPSSPLLSFESVADFSSIGPTRDGRIAPTLYAPGVRVQVPYAFQESVPNHDDVVYPSGTSFSAPAIAGLALYIDEWHFNRTGVRASAALKKAMLISLARPVKRTISIVGNSIVDVGSIPPGYGVPIVTQSILDQMSTVNSAPINSAQRIAYCFIVTQSVVNVTLAWMDVASHAMLDDQVLVNDLDVYVYHGNRQYYLDNHVDSTERISLNATINTMVRIVVTSGFISDGPQHFALAVAGALNTSDCGSCLYTDSTTASLCHPIHGDMEFVTRSCPATTAWNGTECVQQNSSIACTVAHGTGLLVNGTCHPSHCDAHYQLSVIECVCDFAIPCTGHQYAACESNVYGPCPAQQAPPVIIQTSPQPGITPLAIIGIITG